MASTTKDSAVVISAARAETYVPANVYVTYVGFNIMLLRVSCPACHCQCTRSLMTYENRNATSARPVAGHTPEIIARPHTHEGG